MGSGDSTQSSVLAKAENDATAFQKQLARWFAEHARDLPWRREKTVYTIVVSEFMLQQTQVKTALPYYERWLERFPDFAELAAADEAEVLKYWEGLGYYSRARNLHKLAKTLDVLPEFPRTAEGWRKLPGIGPYTSAAISSQAYGTLAAVVDGNVVRVLSRIFALDTAFKNSGAAVKAVTPLADALLDHTQPGLHNEALMELGATVCLRRKPLCTICPLLELCIAGQRGDAEAFPQIQRAKTKDVVRHRAWCVQDDSLLLEQIGADAKRLAGMWELPALETLEIEPTNAQYLRSFRRGIGNERIEERVYRITNSITPQERQRFVPFDELDSVTLSGPHRRFVTNLRKL